MVHAVTTVDSGKRALEVLSLVSKLALVSHCLHVVSYLVVSSSVKRKEREDD